MQRKQQHNPALIRNNGLIRAAMWLSIIAIPCAMIAPQMAVGVIGVSMLIGTCAIVWRLFGVVQIRSLELLLLVALLGNAIGWSYSSLLSDRWRHGYRGGELTAFIFYALIFTLWFLGGACNGLQIAQRLKIRCNRERLWLMVLFILYPLAIASVIFGTLCAFISITAQSLALFVGSINAALIGFLVWNWAREYREIARL